METEPISPETEIKEDQGVSVVTTLFARQNLHDLPTSLLEQITSEDRIESLHDVHGVFQPVHETQQLLDEKMDELRFELSGLASKSEFRDAYEQVARESPDFVDSQLIKFLRADAFDVKKAATRVIKHFQAKKQFFGAEKLGKELQFEDLNEIDRTVLNEGAVQLLSKPDRSGRAIIAQFPRICYFHPAEVSVSPLQLFESWHAHPTLR